MSLILEALRKSEAERRRGQAPDVLADMPEAQATASRTAPAWLWLLPVVVALLVALWFVQQRRDAGPGDAKAQPAERLAASPAQPPEPVLPPVRRLTPPPAAQPQPPPAVASTPPMPNAAPVQATRMQPTALPTAPAGPHAVPVTPPPVMSPGTALPTGPERTTERTPTAQPSAPMDATSTSQVVSLSGLSTAEREALPPLKISMHLWNADPARRFVILDGNRVVEGDRIGDAVVKAITSDGVILDWRGQRIKLPLR